MGRDESLKPIILGAVRSRTALTVEHFLKNAATRQTVLRALSSREVTWELMNFGWWSWRRAFKVLTTGAEGRVKILESQSHQLLNNAPPNNNRTREVLESFKVVRISHGD